MKTIIQEIVDKYYQSSIYRCEFTEWLIKNKELLLEKEKNLMFHAFYGGVGFDESLDDCENLFEQYYQETYNQNK